MGSCQSTEAAETLSSIETPRSEQRNNNGQQRQSPAPGGASAQPVSEQSQQTPPGSISQSSDSRVNSGAKASTSAHHSALKHGNSKLSKEKRVRGTKEWIIGETEDIRDTYDFEKVLGKGQFGTTRQCVHFSTGHRYACKSISKRTITAQEEIEDVRREVQVLHHLAGHPNVVELHAVFEDKHFVHLVMELAEGGELFDSIVQHGRYTEREAAEYFRTMASVVAHCHAMGVVHRDLKPENFLLSSSGADSHLLATDFGLARFFKEGDEFTELVGSAYYVAPEVLKCSYGKEADMWSLGVILCILLSGQPPFGGDTEQQVFRSILKADLDLSVAPWPSISDAAKDCVRRLLVRDPRRRANAAEILDHPWVKINGLAKETPIHNEVLSRLQGFSGMNKLKQEALKMIARFLPDNEIRGLREMFKSIDADGSGTVTVQELREGLRKKGTKIPHEDLERLVMNSDVNGDGTIDYEEFLAATLHRSKLDQDEYMFKAFQELDADGSGTITREEMIKALKLSGINMTDVEHILAEVDTNGDGQIDYAEFCTMMRSAGSSGTPPSAQQGGTMSKAEKAARVGPAWSNMKTPQSIRVSIDEDVSVHRHV